MYKIHNKILDVQSSHIPKFLLVMRIATMIIFIAIVHAGAVTHAQTITLSKTNVSLTDVFPAIRDQTDYDFFYSVKQLSKAKKVSINIKNGSISEVLDQCFKDQPFSYTIKNKLITIIAKVIEVSPVNFKSASQIDVRGIVTGQEDLPLAGASVKVKNTSTSTRTDEKGEFSIIGISQSSVLIISYMGYQTKEVIGETNLGVVKLVPSPNHLKEVEVNAGYYTVKDRERTGSISRVTAKDIEKQPINNVLQAMQANIPGAVITQNTGVPGGGFKVQIRGQNSISQGNDPYYIINGVPFTSATMASSRGQFITADASPLSSINPNDIESIDVLKDADATAIYGSRGANGVVLITTKKGKIGEAKTTINFNQGISRVAKKMDLMNTEQYLQMRNESLVNDNIKPAANEYDVNGTWGNTRNTDWQKELVGGMASMTNVQASVLGGTENIQYLFSGTYYNEGTVFPGESNFGRNSGNLSLQYTSTNKKFLATISANYSQTNSSLFPTDLTTYIRLAPNYPALTDESGALNWENNTMYINPLSVVRRKYDSKIKNLVSSALLQYEIVKGLRLKTSFGYTTISQNDYSNQPLATVSPATGTYGPDQRQAWFATNASDTWILEPQIQWNGKLKAGNLDILVGTTFQENLVDGQNIRGSAYTSDALLENIAAASQFLIQERQFMQYRYSAVFGRINYSLNNRYIFNLTARRDGSSRFGTDNRLANFGAIGAAWIMSEEALFKEKLPFVSFAKLRGSFGITGNDQISDYGYMELWNTYTNIYQGLSTITPSQIANPNYAWEKNKKVEVALELGLLNNRINLSAGFYSNRSSSQLVRKQLAPSTGFSSIQDNLPAKISNTGWEFEFASKNIDRNNFRWSTAVNVTIPSSKLLSYPGLETSSTASLYAVGQPLSIVKMYQTSVNAQTGLYTATDHDGNGIIDDADRYLIGFLGRKYYGGIQNTFSYKGIELDFLIQFVNQTGKGLLTNLAFNPGMFFANSPLSNYPTLILDRWQNQGEQTDHQKYSASTPADEALRKAKVGQLAIEDASFLRLKNVSLSYNLPASVSQKLKLNGIRFFLQGQNLLTITPYKGLDPETQSIANLPALQVFSAGLQVKF